VYLTAVCARVCRLCCWKIWSKNPRVFVSILVVDDGCWGAQASLRGLKLQGANSGLMVCLCTPECLPEQYCLQVVPYFRVWQLYQQCGPCSTLLWPSTCCRERCCFSSSVRYAQKGHVACGLTQDVHGQIQDPNWREASACLVTPVMRAGACVWHRVCCGHTVWCAFGTKVKLGARVDELCTLCCPCMCRWH
jgi:hypothetical protein